MRFGILILSSLAVLTAPGCGEPAYQPASIKNSFGMIEGSAIDLCSLIESKTYRRSVDLGSDSDRIGIGLSMFMKAAEGTPFTEDAEAIKTKINALENLAATRAPIDKQRAAAKELREQIEATKAKL